MNWTQRKYPALVLLCLLAACGDRPPDDDGMSSGDAGAGSSDGGMDRDDAGGGDAGSESPTSSAVIFSPRILAETLGAGDSTLLTVDATITTPLSGDVYMAILDHSGVLEGQVNISPYKGSYVASARTSSTLPVGHHQGALEVRLCRDKECRVQHPGSPLYLPYDLRVIPGTHLTPLTRWPAVRDWETFQGNAAHTGYVPVTLDPSRFSPRWTWKPPESSIFLSPPVIANGLIYLTMSGGMSPENPILKLLALRERDLVTQWRVDFSGFLDPFSFSDAYPPAVSSGKVFVATSVREGSFMWSFNAATGARLSKTALSGGLNSQYAPTIEGGTVYGGTSGGMCAFDLAAGSQNWFTRLSQSGQWTPAVDENYVYSYFGGVLNALVKSTGQVAFTLTGPKSEPSFPQMNRAPVPVLGTNGSLVVVSEPNVYQDTHLTRFDTAMHRLSWSVPGRYGGSPVLAKGVVYATNSSAQSSLLTLEARNESTGELLWNWTPPGHHEWKGKDSDLLVTDNLLFISTNKHVYAVDLATHATVWSYWRGGNMAISANGVLYISSGDTLGAVNLKQ